MTAPSQVYRGGCTPQRAERLTESSQVEFDWPDTDGVIDKLNEEIIEFVKAQTDEAHERACEEFGDIMFTLVNLARLTNRFRCRIAGCK